MKALKRSQVDPTMTASYPSSVVLKTPITSTTRKRRRPGTSTARLGMGLVVALAASRGTTAFVAPSTTSSVRHTAVPQTSWQTALFFAATATKEETLSPQKIARKNETKGGRQQEQRTNKHARKEKKPKSRRQDDKGASIRLIVEDDDSASLDSLLFPTAGAWNMPPWLERYYEPTEDSNQQQQQQQLDKIQESMIRHGFSPEDAEDVVETMIFYGTSAAKTTTNSNSNAPLLLGMIDFVQLILEEHCHFQTFHDDQQQQPTTHQEDVPLQNNMHRDVFASKTVVMAGIVHYAECVAARQEGMDSMTMPTAVSDRMLLLSSVDETTLDGNAWLLSSDSQSRATCATRQQQSVTSVTATVHPNNDKKNDRYPRTLSMDARHIASSAATVKRAELMAQLFLGVGNTRRLAKDEAEGLRGLLLSSMEDWRALALRCIASLFRLEGILQQQQHAANRDTPSQHEDDTFAPPLVGVRSREVVHTAQEAILVYATLAQRLGMHQLKAKIEGKAFQILYQRQYKAVSSVYRQSGEAMRTIRSYLSNEIDGLLRDDDSLMAHIDYLQVSSRVKEPYSFWKKMLKTKAKQNKEDLLLDASTTAASSSSFSGSRTSNLSLAQVQDGIALRVILKAKKASPEESEETTRAREKLLCYYVQHLIRKQFPPIAGEDRMKDYIQFPKPNGYQSLHYTASLAYHTGQTFPFEVQVRSEEMHRIAEYGVAAHWDYKLASVEAKKDMSNSEGRAVLALEGVAEPMDLTNIEVIEVGDATVSPEIAIDEDVVDTSIVFDDLESLKTLNSVGILDEESNTHDQDDSHETRTDKNNAPSYGQQQYLEALVNARDSLVQERVYVFIAGAGSLTMEQGQLVILDSGSSISDAVEYMQKNAPEVLVPPVSESSVFADELSTSFQPDAKATDSYPLVQPTVWRNGQRARQDEAIRNGDVLMIEM